MFHPRLQDEGGQYTSKTGAKTGTRAALGASALRSPGRTQWLLDDRGVEGEQLWKPSAVTRPNAPP